MPIFPGADEVDYYEHAYWLIKEARFALIDKLSDAEKAGDELRINQLKELLNKVEMDYKTIDNSTTHAIVEEYDDGMFLSKVLKF
jgi:hypothetical protein